ncbi:hypothetical protein HDV00_000286 [Rhizophlyctis rosea]|nr:hypothetical protein HDV00_000286 [Rhizophlyctis rosea]
MSVEASITDLHNKAEKIFGHIVPGLLICLPRSGTLDPNFNPNKAKWTDIDIPFNMSFETYVNDAALEKHLPNYTITKDSIGLPADVIAYIRDNMKLPDLVKNRPVVPESSTTALAMISWLASSVAEAALLQTAGGSTSTNGLFLHILYTLTDPITNAKLVTCHVGTLDIPTHFCFQNVKPRLDLLVQLKIINPNSNIGAYPTIAETKDVTAGLYGALSQCACGAAAALHGLLALGMPVKDATAYGYVSAGGPLVKFLAMTVGTKQTEAQGQGVKRKAEEETSDLGSGPSRKVPRGEVEDSLALVDLAADEFPPGPSAAPSEPNPTTTKAAANIAYFHKVVALSPVYDLTIPENRVHVLLHFLTLRQKAKEGL